MSREQPSSSPSPSLAYNSPPPPPDDAEGAALSEAELAQVLDVTLRLGQILATAGAASFRVRDAMRRTARSLGVQHAQFACEVDALHATLACGAHRQTAALRLDALGVDMNRICRIITLTRELTAHPLSRRPEELDRELDAIEATASPYPAWITPWLLGASCGAFCGVIGGSLWQIAAAFAGALVGHLLRLRHVRRHRPVVTVVVSCAFTSALVSWAVARGLGLAVDELAIPYALDALGPGKAVLASVLYLIPGVPLVQSLIDILHFDLTAGLGRAAHASLVLVCIAVGVLTFLSLTGFALV